MSVIPTFWSLSWRNPHPNFWGHSCFASRNKFGASTILTWVYSETAPLVRVQESFRCRLKRWGIQLSEYRSVSFIVLDSVSQEHNSFLLLFGVLSKFGIHQVTLVHQSFDVDCFPILLRLKDYFGLGSGSLFIPCWKTFWIYSILDQVRLCLLVSTKASWQETGLCTGPKRKLPTWPFPRCDPHAVASAFPHAPVYTASSWHRMKSN